MYYLINLKTINNLIYLFQKKKKSLLYQEKKPKKKPVIKYFLDKKFVSSRK